MGDELFNEGGPYKIRRTAPNQHSLQIPIPIGEDQLLARECPREGCSPAYFKVKPRTSLSGEVEIFCPYCRLKAPSNRFFSQGQLDYAKKITIREVQKNMGDFVKKAFGLGPSGRKAMGGGFLKMEMKYKSAPVSVVHRPVEEELRRDIVCPECTLNHSVYGLALWCPDCGKDIFLAHVGAEIQAVLLMLGDFERRQHQFGSRVAARDIENALEDVVSIFEAVLKAIIKRHMLGRGQKQVEVDEFFAKKVGTRFQNVALAAELCQRELGLDVLEGLPELEVETLKATFEKRHPITHNLGIIDSKYLKKARAGELEGRDVRVAASDVQAALDIALRVLAGTYRRIFPGDAK